MTNTEEVNSDLFDMLKTHGFKPVAYDTSGKKVPTPGEADVIRFRIQDLAEMDDKPSKSHVLSVSVDDDGKLKLYYDRELTSNPTFTDLMKKLKMFAFARQIKDWSPTPDSDGSELRHDMAMRNKMKETKLNESYHAMGKRASYNDAVPSVKIVIHHNRALEEGEARYRSVHKIFLENSDGERIACPTTRPGLARVYARLLAEGDKPYGDRWNHLNSVVEEYSKLAGFIRATRSGVFAEGAGQLVEAAVNHYSELRETLHRLTTHRGYNKYFDDWSPVLTENDDSSELIEMFANTNLDPRIEAALPLLARLGKSLVVEAPQEIDQLEQWADGLINESLQMPRQGVAEAGLPFLGKKGLGKPAAGLGQQAIQRMYGKTPPPTRTGSLPPVPSTQAGKQMPGAELPLRGPATDSPLQRGIDRVRQAFKKPNRPTGNG